MIEFDSAWNPPCKVIDRLAEMHPSVIIEHRWSSQRIGYGCGERVYQEGKLLNESCPEDGSEEAVDISLDIWDGNV